jgi:hypothetical protein
LLNRLVHLHDIRQQREVTEEAVERGKLAPEALQTKPLLGLLPGIPKAFVAPASKSASTPSQSRNTVGIRPAQSHTFGSLVPASNSKIQRVQRQLPPAAELQLIYLNDQMTEDDQRLLEITPSASTTYAPTKNHGLNFTTVGPIVGMRR